MNIFNLLTRKYPTKEQILNEPLKHKKDVIKFAREWKKDFWLGVKNNSSRDKFDVIKMLIATIASQFYNKPVNVEFIPDTPIGSHYKIKEQTIVIDNRVSIISALHELAHHVFGPSELRACRWSIWLFKKVFPKAYNRLEFNGHMLIKPSCPQIESTSDSTSSLE